MYNFWWQWSSLILQPTVMQNNQQVGSRSCSCTGMLSRQIFTLIEPPTVHFVEKYSSA